MRFPFEVKLVRLPPARDQRDRSLGALGYPDAAWSTPAG